MNYRDFKAAIALDANEPRDYEQIVFRTPDGKGYHNVKDEFINKYRNNKVEGVELIVIENYDEVFDVTFIIEYLYYYQ